MKTNRFFAAVGALLLVSLLGIGPVRAEKRPIDVQKSVLRVHVSKAGFLSAFGHEHEIEAPVAEGSIDDSSGPAVELRVDAGKLHVMDKEVSPETRAEIQKTMLGPEVLDAARFSDIYFRSTRVVKQSPDQWTIEGDLRLHGQTHPIQTTVTRKDGKYRGSAILKQHDFGINPVSVAGGTVKVKNEIRIEFEIAAKGD